MNQIEFIKYEPVAKEKHLGIATVKLYGKIILRYKIVPTKDGSSFFPAPSSYKITYEGVDRYLPSFTLDSNSEKEELEGIIKVNVKRYLQPQVQAQNNPNNQQYAQTAYDGPPEMPIPSYEDANLPF